MITKTIISFDGRAINDGSDYRATVLNSNVLPAARPVFLENPGNDSVYADTFAVDVRSVAISIRIVDYANRNSLAEQLRLWMKRGTSGTLICKFSDDATNYQMDCVVESLTEDMENSYIAILTTGATSWRASSASTDSWSVTGTGGTKTISVGGSDETALSLIISASAAPSVGYLYQNIYQLVNVPGSAMGKRPWCLTIDHATLVGAGKSLASGYDLAVTINGTDTRRWITGANTASCKIWFNMSMAAGYKLKLKTALASSGGTRVYFDLTDTDTSNYFTGLPTVGIVYHGTEWIAYKNKSNANGYIVIGQRGAYGTTKQAHSIGDLFYWIQSPITLLYGKASATDPASGNALYDNDKPIFNLTDSSNTKWVYDNSTLFYQASKPARTGQWLLRETRQGTVSKIFYIKRDAASGDPALGMKAGSYLSAGTWRPSSIILAWTLRNPAAMTYITANGDKYRTATNWIDTAELQSSLDGVTWETIKAEATPASANTWTTWSQARTALTAGTKFVRLLMQGVYPGGASGYSIYEGLGATVEFDSSTIPTGSFLGETSNATLDLTLTNNANSDAFALLFPILLNKNFEMDTENNTVIYDETPAFDSLAINDGGRDVWLRLDPGNNQLEITSNGVGTLAISLSWYARRL